MRELFREFRIAKERAADEHDQRITHAWCVAVLNNQKKIPKLESLLSRQKRQTVSEQKAVMYSIAQHLGVKVLTRKLTRDHAQQKGS